MSDDTATSAATDLRAQRWRFIDIGPTDPYAANGRAPILGSQVRDGGDPIAFTAVWGESHVNVGWFDDVDATLDLEACERLGVKVVRRPVYGGGTAFYEEGCAVMWNFLVAKDRHPDLDAALEVFSPVLMDALERMGLGEVALEGRSDLRWHGRKVGAITAQDVVICNNIGGFLNIAQPDVDLYLEVARVPDDKFKDKLVKDLREYVVSASEIAGRDVSYEDFRDALLGAFEDAGFELYHQPLTDEERDGVASIGDKIRNPDYIRRISSARFERDAPAGTRVGFGNEKGRKLCRAGVAIDAEGTIVDAMLAGDMHVSPPKAIDRIAQNLVGADSADVDDLRRRIAELFESDEVRQAEGSLGITTDDLLRAVEKAVANAS